MTDVKLALRGLRGESTADILRRTGVYDTPADATDEEAMLGLVTALAETANTDHFAATHAAAVAANPGYADGDVIQVWADENFLGVRTYYERVAGVLTFRNFAVDTYAEVAGETGVMYRQYPVGDVRRYGVFPDGVTNWESTYPERMTAIYANSCLPNVWAVWPRGYYATSINLSGGSGGGANYSGSRMYADLAEFGGVLHLIDGITDVKWLGDWTSYDRLGLANAKRCEFGIVRLKNDFTKNVGGLGCRGYHLLSSTDIVFDRFYIDDMAQTIAGAPNDPSNWAAFAVQNIDVPTEGGYRITGNGIYIRNSQGHGFYCNAVDLNVGEVIIDGYGNMVIDLTGAPGGESLIDADSKAQSQQGCGLWINRSNGHIGYLRIRQSNAAPANDIYTLLIDETGRAGTTPRESQFTFGRVDLEVGGTNNRGLCVGEVLAASPAASCRIDTLTMRLKTGLSMATGYGMINMNKPLEGFADLRYRLSIDKLIMVDPGAALQVRVMGSAAAGVRVYSDLQINDWIVATMGTGKILTVDATLKNGSVTGRIGRIRGYYGGGSQSGQFLCLVDGAKDFHIGEIMMDLAGINIGLLKVKNVTDGSAKTSVQGLNGSVGVELEGTKRFSLSGRVHGNLATGIGVQFTGTNEDLALGPLNVQLLATGYKKGTACVFTRGSAVSVTATGAFGTATTDLTSADFPTASQLACTGFAP